MGGDHLLWIYWQETGGNVKVNTTVKQDGSTPDWINS